MDLNRFHFFYCFRFVPKGLLLCLWPVVRALFLFDKAGLAQALGQDTAILALALFFGAAGWRRAGWRLGGGLFAARQGLLFGAERQLPCSEVASLVITRPVWFRLFGASRLTLYLQHSRPARLTFCLPAGDAARLARALLPAEDAQPVFAPAGAGRLALLLLGHSPFCRAGLQTAGGQGVVAARYGLFTLTQRRVRLCAVTACTVQASPAARLLGWYPVYLSAGFDKGHQAPVFLCKRGDWADLSRLVPGVQPPHRPPKGRSPAAFLGLPGGGAALCLAGLVFWGQPAFAGGLVWFAALTLAGAEGWRREGAWRQGDRLTLCYIRRLTRYEVCVFSPRLGTVFCRSLFGQRTGRGTLFVKLPAGFCKIRGLRAGDADALGV